MSSDYGYINARVRGMKAKLLGPEFFTEALGAAEFRSFMTALSQSPYQQNIEEAQASYEGLKALDAALARNFYGTARSILNFTDGTPHDIVALLLLRYDLNNLKAIARAKHAGRSAEDTQEVFFPAGTLKPAVLENVASAPDMAGAAQVLLTTPTPLRGAFARAAQSYSSDGDLYALELALDRAYYKEIAQALKELDIPKDFARYLRREIDATNLRTALQMRGNDVQADELFVSGGREINRGIFEGILNDPAGGLQSLSNTSFSQVAEVEPGEVAGVVRELLDSAAKRLSGDPLGVGVVVNYLRQKEAESAKLRLLARGKYYGVPRETLAKELGDA